jgi:hypothetical protein
MEVNLIQSNLKDIVYYRKKNSLNLFKKIKHINLYAYKVKCCSRKHDLGDSHQVVLEALFFFFFEIRGQFAGRGFRACIA